MTDQAAPVPPRALAGRRPQPTQVTVTRRPQESVSFRPMRPALMMSAPTSGRMRSGSGCGACGSNAAEVLAPKPATLTTCGAPVEAVGAPGASVTDGGTNGVPMGGAVVSLLAPGLASTLAWEPASVPVR